MLKQNHKLKQLKSEKLFKNEIKNILNEKKKHKEKRKNNVI